MKLLHLSSALAAASTVAAQGYDKPSPAPRLVYATNNNTNITWVGEERDGVEVFLGIQYGLDTCGENRFKPPRPFKLEPDTRYDVRTPGPACPQPLGQWYPPLTLGNVQKTSEDCLNLNIWRPKVKAEDPENELGFYSQPLPVMVWIHGGGLWQGSNMEPSTDPTKMILQAAPANATFSTPSFPVLHVAMNYRLGVFGFAQSEALRKEGSENAGLRDQRLAIEWVRNNIATFGGDPHNIIVAGQSSGALSATMQHLAYGGQKPVPIRKFIAQSGALEPGIIGNYTTDAMETVVAFSHCNSNSSIHHPDTIKCLRNIPYQSLVNASVPSYEVDGEHNLGMIWLPSVDGDFLPAAPSQLMKEGKFSNASFLIGWTDDDVPATDFNIHYDVDVFRYMRVFLAGIPEQDNTTVNDLLSLYPVGEFGSPEALPIGNLSSQYYRTSRILRDAVTVCPSLYLAEALNKYSTKPNRTELHDVPVFLYHFNYTILEPALQKIHDLPYYGVTTFAEISFVFNNLNKYQEAGYASNFTEVDTDLAKRTTLSWSAYAMAGSPSLRNTGTLQAWAYAYAKNETFEASTLPGVIEDWLNNTAIYVLGGPREGISAIDGEWSYEGLRVQKLRERCAFLNSDKWIKYLQY